MNCQFRGPIADVFFATRHCLQSIPLPDRAFRFVLLTAVLSCIGVPVMAQNGMYPGQSIRWQRAQSPFTPGPGAIQGGPGSDPNPGSPMYVCRAQDQGSLVPGKWVGGNCNVAFNNAEDVMSSYEVAYGNAQWGPYQGNLAGVIQTGHEPDGRPLYSCRARYTTNFPRQDYGYQPGKLVSDGSCHIPFGGAEVAVGQPFEVLYGSGGGYPPNPYPPYYPYPYPYPPPPAPLPPCRWSDPGVVLNGDGLWAGPNCTPADNQGRVPGAPPPPNPNAPPPGPYVPGPSSVSWQSVQSPFQPGDNAVKGGPGNGPKPDAPLYICRAYYNGGLYPGKWIGGQCSISDADAKEQKVNAYEVANGSASWRNFDGNIGALVPGGYDVNGTPLYICRKQLSFFGNKGYQPGRLSGGQCHIPYGGMDNISGLPFEALYNVFPASALVDQQPPGQPSPAVTLQPTVPDGVAPALHGIQVAFVEGTGDTAGTVTVTNGENGKTVTKPLPASSTPQQCAVVLQQAAFEAGLRIQALPDGKGLMVFGINNSVNVTQTSVSVGQF
jgi:hypothetical protein